MSKLGSDNNNETSGKTAAEKQADLDAAVRSIISNFLGLIVPVLILVYWFGGSSTRAWMLGVVWGLFGLQGQPDLHLIAGAATNISQTVNVPSEPPLKLLGHGCYTDYGYQTCEGEVRNETKDRLENVMVEVKFKDANNAFIKAESAMINYQPLMPGQSSPFKVMASNNPQIRHYVISFKQMFGGELKASR